MQPKASPLVLLPLPSGFYPPVPTPCIKILDSCWPHDWEDKPIQRGGFQHSVKEAGESGGDCGELEHMCPSKEAAATQLKAGFCIQAGFWAQPEILAFTEISTFFNVAK